MPKKYPDEFKVKAIRRYEKGESIQSLCQELHISQSTLYHWRREYCSIQTATHTYTPKEFDQHGISHYTDLEQKITELQDSNEQTAAALKTAEHRLPDLALLIKHTATYKELKPLYSEYKKSHDKEKYLRGREREIILFEASARALKASGVGDKLPDLAKLREEYSRLSEEKNRLYAEYCNCTKE